MKLISSSSSSSSMRGSSSELPAAETCALDEGEDDDDDDDDDDDGVRRDVVGGVKVRQGATFFSKLTMSGGRPSHQHIKDKVRSLDSCSLSQLLVSRRTSQFVLSCKPRRSL